MSQDGTIPVPDSSPGALRTCPVCTRVFSLRDVEVGLLNEYGEAVFFCSQEHKTDWQTR